MLREVGAVLWKEWREHVRRREGWFAASNTMAATAFVLGVWTGIRETEFIAGGGGPLIAAGVGSMMTLLVTPDTFAGERERRTLLAFYATAVSTRAIFVGKVLAASAMAVTLGTIFGAASVLTVLVSGVELGPLWHWSVLSSATAFGVVVALFLSAVGCLTSLRSPTVIGAQQSLFLTTFVMLALGSALSIGPVVLLRRLAPDNAWARESLRTFSRLVEGMTPVTALLAGTACLVALTAVVTLLGVRTLQADRRRGGMMGA